ncbi:MAG: bifunctional folylpolyglutamate synthase/dihydrofolate synthase [Bacteroidia bacterium]|nr:bifunctional folylpolyglutamate synthase/dihydrofolate synthase [Bacteroidia bacterium]
MTYTDTLTYLFARLPMFQRIGAAAYKSDLDNTYALMKVLKNPEKNLVCIHVAGTNGKGSTSHLLASILQEAGYKVGLYTSPHLLDFRERVKINGAMITEQYVVDFVAKNKNEFEAIEPSFFEWSVALAFDYFATQNVDIAVIEVGLGGRLDSTNVITPLVSVITNIGIDHVQFLGDTFTAIATEKAGVIKASTPVVIGEVANEDVRNVFVTTARNNNAPLLFAHETYTKITDSYTDDALKISYLNANNTANNVAVTCDLTGVYQHKNIATVLTVCDAIKKYAPQFRINNPTILRGIAHVKRNTGLLGRWQVLSVNPRIIADTGHNEDGIAEVLQCLEREIELKTLTGTLHFILGVVNDKDINKMITQLKSNAITLNATYYTTQPNIPRALSAETLHKNLSVENLKSSCNTSVASALELAKANYILGDLIFVGGSTFMVADALKLF